MASIKKSSKYNYEVKAKVIEHDYLDPELYLYLTYNYKDYKGDIHKVTIPYIKIPLKCGFDMDIRDPFKSDDMEFSIGLTDDRLCLLRGTIEDHNGIFHENLSCLDEIIEKAKPKKLTVEEIEKALGYKIEIVSEANKK